MTEPEKQQGHGSDFKRKMRDRNRYDNGGVGFFMFLAFIGAAVYFVSRSHGFWDGVLAILKAVVWPAFLVFQLLQHYLG